MAFFKCKMCGGAIEFEEGKTVGVCDSCGTKQTLPRLDDEKKINLYDRADHFRRNDDFDKAMGIYEQILNEDSTDAEAYWSLVLCRYGIEYVEDPVTRKRIPTVNRTQYTSVYADEDYKSALRCADDAQKEVLKEEADIIDGIQKSILAISQKEEPFDVFICYKETDDRGRRTRDSVLATEIYDGLTEEGYRVFLSRITLEDKLGEEYEPYIFAALSSARVMIAVGTKPEFFNAAWVKNEWSRYLALIKGGAKKTLIPAYRDMDPYDLPEEFSHLQAQDMSKLGFMQDLVRGVKKILGEHTAKPEDAEKTATEAAPKKEPPTNVQTMIDHALLDIESGDFSEAERRLDIAFEAAPTNPAIYVGRLLLERRVPSLDQLAKSDRPLDSSMNYTRALRFADPALKEALTGINTTIKDAIFDRAVQKLNGATDKKACQEAMALFGRLGEYRDSGRWIDKCQAKGDELEQAAKNEEQYVAALGHITNIDKLSVYTQRYNAILAIQQFKPIADYKDARKRIDEAQRIIYRCDGIIKAKKKRKRITITAIASALAIILGSVCLYEFYLYPKGCYREAEDLMGKEKYTQAAEKYEEAGSYGDATEKRKECLYREAVALRNDKKYDEANVLFKSIKGYKDSAKLIHEHSWKITKQKAATCKSEGYKNYTCDGCGQTKSETLAVTSEHSWKVSSKKAATCDSDGYEKSVCKVCGKTKTKTLTKLGHNWKAATCTSPKKCSRCGKTSGSALGHTDGVKCGRCGKILFSTITYTGTGSAVKTGLNLPSGTFRLTVTMISGDSLMEATLNYGGRKDKYGFEEHDDTIFLDYDPGASEVTTITGPISNGAITVNAGKSYYNTPTEWKITIEGIK